MAYVVNRGTRAAPKWYAKFKDLDGKWKQRNTGQTTKKGAQEWADGAEARVKRGLIGVPEPTPDERAAAALTVAGLVEKFLAEYSRPKIKSMADYRTQGRSALSTMIKPFPIADLLAVQARRADVETWRDAVSAAGYSAHSVNRALALLGRAYNWSIDRELLAATARNPVSRVEKMQIRPFEAFYTLDEVHKLLARPDCPVMLWTALYTGLRKGELFGLTWACVRLDGELPRLEVRTSYASGSTKSGKARAVPIHPELLPVLRAWKDECPPTEAGLVFPVNEAQGRGRRVAGWRMGTTADMAGLPELLRDTPGCHVPEERTALEGREKKDRCWQATRHTFATLFLEASGNGDALSKLLGHSLGGGGALVTVGYTHTSLAYLQRELVKMTLRPPAPAGVVDLQGHQRRAG